MSDRTNLTIDSDVYDQLAEAKGSNDTWSEFLSRLFNSAQGEQVHIDRSTLQDFDTGDEQANGPQLRASDQGAIELTFVDGDGTQLGSTSLAALEPEQTVVVTISTGSLID